MKIGVSSTDLISIDQLLANYECIGRGHLRAADTCLSVQERSVIQMPQLDFVLRRFAS